MVSITRPEDSRAELDRMTACAEAMLEALDLPYRTVVLCHRRHGLRRAAHP